LNHSCNPNCIFIFSGPSMSIRSVRAIPMEGELTIPYIPMPTPSSERQKQLKDQYFFDCSCEYCHASLSCGQPDMPASLKVGMPMNDILQLEQEADLLQARAADARSSKEAAATLTKALKLFHPYKDVYPKWRPPWPEINHNLTEIYLDRNMGQWLLAVAHALQAYFYISPVLYPDEWNPLRAVKTLTLLRLVLELGFQTNEGLDKKRYKQALKKYGIDWPVVAAALANEVASTIPKGFGLDSSFAAAAKPSLEGLLQYWQKVRKGAWDEERGKLQVLANDVIYQ
ncbi:MAG: hypothetical protein Q9174_006871, partial [Haloplaca sp. 1 TL-2023]